MSERAEVSRVETDLSRAWMEANPELAGAALIKFAADHPPESWSLKIRRAYMPGMWLTLSATRKESGQ